jgi:nucleotide-binding universal stress UspA family protein
MLHKALVKVSLKEPRGRFLEMAGLLKYFGTKDLILVHVVNGNGGRGRAGKELDELAGAVRELGFEVETRLAGGHVATRIIETAHEVRADFVCVYWMPKNALRQILLGSIDLDILRMSDLPVFVHNRGWLGDIPDQLESVLYATDFTAVDAGVIPYLSSKEFRAEKLHILHVGERAPDPQAERARREKARNNLARLAEECRGAYNEIETLEVVGRGRKEIVRRAKALDVDLIVIGKSSIPNPFDNVLGSTAETVTRRAGRSVFIVPGGVY